MLFNLQEPMDFQFSLFFVFWFKEMTNLKLSWLFGVRNLELRSKFSTETLSFIHLRSKQGSLA